MDHRSSSIYRTFSDSYLCGSRHSGQRGRELPDRLKPFGGPALCLFWTAAGLCHISERHAGNL